MRSNAVAKSESTFDWVALNDCSTVDCSVVISEAAVFTSETIFDTLVSASLSDCIALGLGRLPSTPPFVHRYLHSVGWWYHCL